MAEKEESTAQALTRLASAQEHMASDMEKMVTHQAEMNGNVAKNVLGLALWAQWADNHTGDDGLHAMLKEQAETVKKQVAENRKLARAAVTVQIILALGLAIGTWMVAVR